MITMDNTELLETYINNKKAIFDNLVLNIENTSKTENDKFIIRNISLLDQKIDIVSYKKDWIDSLSKALEFYKSIEEYESCAKCYHLINSFKKT